MTSPVDLSPRERQVLEAVVRAYVETAEPAGSRTISKRFGLGVSPATIRNTMADLEEKGFLFHPHTSAGRIPTDLAYRVYVDALIGIPALPAQTAERMAEEIRTGDSAIETILRRTAQSLGILTQELGVALGPRIDLVILERIGIMRQSSSRLILVLTLRGGTVRTVFLEVAGEISEPALAEVERVLNERLGGLSLADIRSTIPQRLRDASDVAETAELLHIFVQEGERVFDVGSDAEGERVMLGQASLLADKPEFASGDGLRRLMELTDTRTDLATILRKRGTTPGVSITIGREHDELRLGGLTLVTAEYHAGALSGVIGVVGPTRMPYEKVISVVHHASQLVTELLS